MKKILFLMAMVAVVLSMASCGGDEPDGNGIPAVPTGLKIEKEEQYGAEGTLSWNAVPSATHYIIHLRSKDFRPDCGWIEEDPVTVTEPKWEYDLNDYMGFIMINVILEMRVSAVNQKGESEQSEAVTDQYGI